MRPVQLDVIDRFGHRTEHCKWVRIPKRFSADRLLWVFLQLVLVGIALAGGR